jgi:hypothetical protein
MWFLLHRAIHIFTRIIQKKTAWFIVYFNVTVISKMAGLHALLLDYTITQDCFSRIAFLQKIDEVNKLACYCD